MVDARQDGMSDTNQALIEARLILERRTALLPTREHLQALQEHHEIQMVRILNQLELMKRFVGNLS